jgi:hypothetical protein
MRAQGLTDEIGNGKIVTVTYVEAFGFVAHQDDQGITTL